MRAQPQPRPAERREERRCPTAARGLNASARSMARESHRLQRHIRESSFGRTVEVELLIPPQDASSSGIGEVDSDVRAEMTAGGKNLAKVVALNGSVPSIMQIPGLALYIMSLHQRNISGRKEKPKSSFSVIRRKGSENVFLVLSNNIL